MGTAVKNSPPSDNVKYLCKGIRVKRFRRPKKWKIQNRILMAFLLHDDIKLSEVAERIRVSSRRVSSWVYEGSHPSSEHRAALAHLIGVEQSILFYDDQQFDQVMIPEDAPKFTRKVLLSPIECPILCGLLMVHNISPTYVCKTASISANAMKDLLHRGKIPKEEYLQKLSDFFKLPVDILTYRREKKEE